MKHIHFYINVIALAILAWAIPDFSWAQTCDAVPMDIKAKTDWTTDCAKTMAPFAQCDRRNGPLCDGTAASNWLYLGPSSKYCLAKPACNVVGFNEIQLIMSMTGTWTIQNTGSATAEGDIELKGCIKGWANNNIFPALVPDVNTAYNVFSLPSGGSTSGAFTPQTATVKYEGDYVALFKQLCEGTVCFDGQADGFIGLNLSSGNVEASTIVEGALKACVSYRSYSWNVTGTEAACETSADGKVFVSFTPAPGTSASDYEIRVGNGSSWTVAQTAVSGANTISGLAAGSYTVAVIYKPLEKVGGVKPSDDAGCGYCKASVTVGAATATLTCSSDPDCPGGAADGSVTVGVTGNNLGTVSYDWGNGNVGATLNGLTQGNYTVTVTYGPNGKCSKTTTCTVVTAPGVGFTVNPSNVVCNGAKDGKIVVTPTSGKANYTISVTGKSNQTSDGAAKTFSNLSPGTYTITVVDANGCEKTEQVDITEPNPVSIICANENTSCKGLSDGKIKVTSVTSDVGGPYKVSVDQIAGGNNDIAESMQAIPYEASVGKGTYVITVKDKNGCIARCTTIVKDGFTPAINCEVTQIACFGGKGTITATASGKDADDNPVASTFDYVLSGSASASNTTGIFTGLGAGTYTVTATKTGNVGCSVACTGNTIVEPAQLSCTITGNSTVCPNAKISFSGPAGMTNYIWSVTGAAFTNNGSSIEVTAPVSGSFEVKLTTKKISSVDNTTLCESGECTKTVNVTVPTCPIIAAKIVCAGAQNVEYDAGSGYTDIVWSTSNAKISIASGQGTHKPKFNVASNAVGEYQITFTANQNGCPVSCEFTLTVYPLPTVTLTPEQPVCRNPPTGKIAVVASGGTQPYVFVIRQGSPTGTIITPSITNQTATGLTYNGLAAGTYYVEVIDRAGEGCSSDPEVQILEVQDPLDFKLTLDCENQVAGNVAVNLTNITGGAAAPNGYEYQVDGTAGTWIALVLGNSIFLPVNSGDHTIYLREKGVITGCDPYGKVINTTCCKLEGVCKLTTPSQLTGCDLSVVPAAKTNPTDVFSGVTFCKEARIKVTTTDGGSLCGTGLTRTYTYLLYDDVIDNNVYDEGKEPFISGTCSETYTVKAPVLSCNAPSDYSIEETCTTKNIADLFSTWKNSFTYTGGCSPMVRYLVSIDDAVEVEYQSIASITAPTFCGGKVKIKILVKDACTTEKMCMSTFEVAKRSDVTTTAPKSTTKDQCDLANDFSTWKALFSASGGCSPIIKYFVSIDGGNETEMTSIDNVTAPGKCGGSVKIRIVITDDCSQRSEKEATYIITKRSDVTTIAPKSTTKDQCDLANDFSTWKALFSASGGCSPIIKYFVSIDGGNETEMTSIDNVTAPGKCGGSVKIRIVITDDCSQRSEKEATYTITKRSDVTTIAPKSITKDQCDLANDFNSWKALFSASGGCSPIIKYFVSIDGGDETEMTSIDNVTAPGKCGGSVKIRIVITDDCSQRSEKEATYTITKRSDVTTTAPKSTTKDQCDLANDFSTWKALFSASGGCIPIIKYFVSIDGGNETEMTSIDNVTAPGKCGGSVKIRIVITDDCSQRSEKEATYTITKRSDVTTIAPKSITKDQCDLANDFSTWKALFSASGGCSPIIKYFVSIDGGDETEMTSIDNVTAPGKCGGSVKIRIVITDDCSQRSEKEATYTITKRSDVTTIAPKSTTKDQCDLANDFSTWKALFSASGGCSPIIKYFVSIDGGNETEMTSIDNVTAPGKCGGSVKIRIVITDDCSQRSEKEATYTITKRSDVTTIAPKSITKDRCDLASDFNTWKALFSASGGCSPIIKYFVSIDGGNETEMTSIDNVTAPGKCGGSVKIRIVITDDCDQRSEKEATYTITKRLDVITSAPQSITKDRCDLASDFNTWKAQFSASGGCGAVIKYFVSIDGGDETEMTSIDNVTAPGKCGGSVKIRIVITDDCSQRSEKEATYIITKRSDVTTIAPKSTTKDQCDLANDFSTWKALFSASGGCSPIIKYFVSIDGGNETEMTSIDNVTAPGKCGGSVKIRIVITDDCSQRSEKEATYTITKRSDVTTIAPKSITKDQCDLANDFNSWKALFSASGGCSPIIKYFVSIDGGDETEMTSIDNVTAPGKCGGSVKIRIVITDDCSQLSEKEATYTITKRSDIVINSPDSKTVKCLLQDGINTEFAAWLAQFNTSGGCSSVVKYYVNNKEVANLTNVAAPSECGGTVTIKVTMTDDCSQTATKTASFEAIPKPVGLPKEKTIYSCIAVDVDLPDQIKCNIPSTFKWYSVASVGSATPYDNPNIEGETFSITTGTNSVINDVLTNVGIGNQTIIYRVVPTSNKNCIGEPFYITVTIRPKATIECLACMSQVNVSLDKNCKLKVTPDLVIEGFAQCPNRDLLQDALEVLIDDGKNNDSYIDCAGTYNYIIRLKPEYEKCFDYTPCWGKITAEDKTGPILECEDFIEKTLECYDVNYVLNNPKTIGKVGEIKSPRATGTSSQTINNAEGIGENCANLVPPGLVDDNIKNLGYAYFRDNCVNCGCRITLKWTDKVVFYSCEEISKNGGIYATIFREWVATDCNGMSSSTIQKINFKRPALKEFNFNGLGDDEYDRVVTYNACSPDKSLIKYEDVTPFVDSYFYTEDNKRRIYLDKVECNYSVSIKDTEFPICNGKGVKIDRELHVFDWCAGGIVKTFHILIKIGDFEAPTMKVPTFVNGAPYNNPAQLPLVKISTGPMDCTAAFPISTAAAIKNTFGYDIKDNCSVANVSVSVYTKDTYIKGILVNQGPKDAFADCKEDDRPKGFTKPGDDDDDHGHGGYFPKCENKCIAWKKVDYAIVNGNMVGVPVGRHLMVIEAFDGCYNSSCMAFEFAVEDKIAPVMKCDDQLQVSLTNANGYTSGYGQVAAKDVDEGSWDNCKLAWIAVRRNVPSSCEASFIAKGYDSNGNGKLDAATASGDVSKADGIDRNGDGDIADFGEAFVIKGGKLMTPLQDIAEFFCCDLSEKVTVELWGADTADNPNTDADETNYNFCWMELAIEDKVAPTCAAPWDLTVDCDEKCLETIDDKKASVACFGDVTITSGNDCAPMDTVYTTEKKLKCGSGYIDRIWTLTKQTAKGPITITCKQRVHVRAIHEYNIIFPKDATSDCKTPIVDTVLTDELACDILAVNVTDKRYDASDNECYKIFRTYTVINWCVYDDQCGDPLAEGNVYVVNRATFSNYGKAPIYVLVRDENRNLNEEFYLSKDSIPNNADDERFFPAKCTATDEYYHAFQYTQIIKVYDSERPVVTGIRDTFCTSATACTANITKVVTIKDNCTDKVELERQSLMIAPNQTLDASKMITYSPTSWSAKDLGNGQFEIKVSNLPEGTHDLIVVGRDECGNLSLPTRIPFVVKDCKAPAPICVNGLSVNLMPDGNNGGMMTVWATDFVASKIYDCNGQGPETKDGLKLVTKYSINRVKEAVNPNQTSISVNCADLELGFILVELHAWDEVGNHDFCVTFLEVQDNNKVCSDSTNVTTGEISGIITTDETEPVTGVKIEVSGNAQLNQNSSANGTFNFNQLQLGNDFTIAAQLDKDHLNGVTTFDLVLLQKHILGAQTITNPYRLIAADVNNSKTISTLDLIQIRKLILNIDQRFNNVTSWRFVDAAYKFPDSSNPWAETFPEVVNVNDLAGKVQANFIAVKMGDVNGSAVVSKVASSEIRGSKALNLQTEEQAMKTGQRYAVSIRAKDLDKIQGYQFTLQVDPAQAKIENIEYNGLMKAEHFGFFPQTGQITTSFVRSPQTSAAISKTSGDDVLFTLMLKAESNIALSQILNINSRLTPQEAYSVQDELMDVKLMVSDATLSDKAVLYQNKPNPFVDQTAIDFYLPNATSAVLIIRDVKGALLYKVEGNYSKGNNQVILKQEHLHTSGVLYYTLETADFTATQKMVLLNK